MSVFVFGYAVGIWPPATTLAERREREKNKSFRVMLLFNGIVLLFSMPTSTDVYGLMCHVGLIDSHSALLI